MKKKKSKRKYKFYFKMLLTNFLFIRIFEYQQELNTRQIIEKLLKEKNNIEKTIKLYPNLFNINLKPLKPIVIF